jgi:hypothetical protein
MMDADLSPFGESLAIDDLHRGAVDVDSHRETTAWPSAIDLAGGVGEVLDSVISLRNENQPRCDRLYDVNAAVLCRDKSD